MDNRWQWIDIWEAAPHKGELSKALGVGLSTASSWFQRGTVPPHVWRPLKRHMALVARLTLTAEDMLDMAERAHEKRRGTKSG